MENLTAQRFGKLVVLRHLRSTANYIHFWECLCDCGNKTITRASNLKRRKNGTKHCRRCSRLTHGHSAGYKSKSGRSPTYLSWLGMFNRVNGKTEKLRYSYKHVSICKRWLDFNVFLSDMGERPSKKHTLDRIDNLGNYEPQNCRWADWSTQLKNRRPRRPQPAQ